uniref:Uncharacterized protein n=1 Tax=viral metagenome TaxID=1070528 RepID=A0A6M3LAA2_9ZZZZ
MADEETKVRLIDAEKLYAELRDEAQRLRATGDAWAKDKCHQLANLDYLEAQGFQRAALMVHMAETVLKYNWALEPQEPKVSQ